MSEIERAIECVTTAQKNANKEGRTEDVYNLMVVKQLLRAELDREKNQLTCDGCKQQGEWDNELEYGYNCPCCNCKRNSVDRYEPKGERDEG